MYVNLIILKSFLPLKILGNGIENNQLNKCNSLEVKIIFNKRVFYTSFCQIASFHTFSLYNESLHAITC